jgi:hypothetical protein
MVHSVYIINYNRESGAMRPYIKMAVVKYLLKIYYREYSLYRRFTLLRPNPKSLTGG